MQGLSPKTTNFNNTFDGCESLEYLDPDIFKNFTTAGIAMRSLFLNCKNLKNAPTFKYFKFKPSCEYLYNQTFQVANRLQRFRNTCSTRQPRPSPDPRN